MTNKRAAAIAGAIVSIVGSIWIAAAWLGSDDWVEERVRAGLASELHCKPSDIRLELRESRVAGTYYGTASLVNKDGNRELFDVRAKTYPDRRVVYKLEIPA